MNTKAEFSSGPLSRRLLVPVLGIALFGVTFEGAVGMDFLDMEYRLNGRETVALFTTAREASEASVFTLHEKGDRRPFVLATVIGENGLAVTKASELEMVGELEARNYRRQLFEVEVVGMDDANDIAVIRIHAPDAVPVRWQEAEEIPMGTWIAGPTPRVDRLRVGVISARSRVIESRGASLGVTLTSVTEDEKEIGVRIRNVFPESAAEKAGMQVDDIIQRIDGKAVRNMEELSGEMKKHSPGKTIIFHILRREDGDGEVEVEESLESEVESEVEDSGGAGGVDDGEAGEAEAGESSDEPVNEDTVEGRVEIELEVVLDSPSDVLDRFNRNQQMSGTTSRRKDPFSMVLQHDTPIPPEAMGGALFDIDGFALGVNIARVDRVTTFALPAVVVVGAVENVMGFVEGEAVMDPVEGIDEGGEEAR